MGIVEQELAEFKLPDSDLDCRIEQHGNNRIDIHIGPFMYPLSPDEFEEFADGIIKAGEELESAKDFDSSTLRK